MNEEVTQTWLYLAETLRSVLVDGGRKRAAGLKPHWTTDGGHADAMERHLAAWERGERTDADSGAHPLVHAACRALMLAWQEENFRPVLFDEEESAPSTNPTTPGPSGAPPASESGPAGCCGGFTSDSTCCDGC